ncbi:MAG: DUF5690 family protein, partial [Myxococcota bacterium]|nr:DUF5690 family protein [Myxococcota bacterium]
LMGFGFALVGLSALGEQSGRLGPLGFMIGTGLGAYLAYVPFNAILFERMMAYTRFTGTAVFAIYLADASGYTGALGLQLWKDLAAGEASRLEFFTDLCYLLSILGMLLVFFSAVYFARKSTATEPEATDLM